MRQEAANLLKAMGSGDLGVVETLAMIIAPNTQTLLLTGQKVQTDAQLTDEDYTTLSSFLAANPGDKPVVKAAKEITFDILTKKLVHCG